MRHRCSQCSTSRRYRGRAIASACRAPGAGRRSSTATPKSTAAAAWATSAASRPRPIRSTAIRIPFPSPFPRLERSSSNPNRVVVESVRPQVDCGRFPVKRVLGEEVRVEADVFTDGHDSVACEVLYRFFGDRDWKSVPMEFFQNDHWAASFRVDKLGRYEYTVRGWVDPFLTWQRDLQKRYAAGQDLSIDFL